MKLSVVTTLYCSEKYIQEFIERTVKVVFPVYGDDFEIIIVNDGSPDGSLSIVKELIEESRVAIKLIDLSRNFGHHKAIMSGLAHANGEMIFLIDSDLEEQPEWFATFNDKIEACPVDVVYGVQTKRKGGFFERLTGFIFYRLFRFFTQLPQPDNIVTARLMTKRYVQALLLHEEAELNIGGLFLLTGFSQVFLTVEKLSTSQTSYSMRKRITSLVNAITSFSNFPLIFIFYSGLAIACSAVMFIAYILGQYFLVSEPPSGYTSVIASIWLFSGLIIFFMGILGIYLSKIFLEVKRRPRSIIRQIYESKAKLTEFENGK
ncbi:MAG: glycosyltransferase family 2 protein [Aestuariibacter sp.]